MAKDKHRLNVYVEENKQLAETILDADFAVRAQKDLGFSITAGNVKGARDVFGIKKAFVNQYPSSTPNGCITIARELIELMISLGQVPSEQLKQIARNI